MNQREVTLELMRIEELARKIVQQNTSQTCGTEYQKWTYALLRAREEYYGTK